MEQVEIRLRLAQVYATLAAASPHEWEASHKDQYIGWATMHAAEAEKLIHEPASAGKGEGDE